MNTLPSDDIGAIGRSTSAVELTTRLDQALRRRGFGGFEYLWLGLGAGGGARTCSLAGPDAPPGRDRPWLDPFVLHCRAAYTPVVWQWLSPDRAVRQQLVWSPWKGLPIRAQSGVAIPVHGPDGGFGLLSAAVASETTGPTGIVAPEHVHCIHASAFAAYDVVLANHANPAFGLAYTALDGRDAAVLLYQDIEKARVLTGVAH